MENIYTERLALTNGKTYRGVLLSKLANAVKSTPQDLWQNYFAANYDPTVMLVAFFTDSETVAREVNHIYVYAEQGKKFVVDMSEVEAGRLWVPSKWALLTLKLINKGVAKVIVNEIPFMNSWKYKVSHLDSQGNLITFS